MNWSWLFSNLNFVTPALDFAEDVAHLGRIADFMIPGNTGYRDKDLERMLANNGIDSWGWMLDEDGTQLFTVPYKDRKMVVRLFSKLGVPIYGKPI